MDDILCTAAENKFYFLINEVMEMTSSDKHMLYQFQYRYCY